MILLIYPLHLKMRSGVIRGKNAIFPLIASANEFARSIQSRLYRSHLQVRSVYTDHVSGVGVRKT